MERPWGMGFGVFTQVYGPDRLEKDKENRRKEISDNIRNNAVRDQTRTRKVTGGTITEVWKNGSCISRVKKLDRR